MAAGRMQGIVGNWYFSQNRPYAAGTKGCGAGNGMTKGKSIAEFSEKEWDNLLERMDSYMEECQEGIGIRKEEALEEQQEQRQQARQEWLACIAAQSERSRLMRMADAKERVENES